MGGLSFQRGIPCHGMTRGFPGDAASPVQHSLFPGSREKRNQPCFTTKNGAQLKVPGVPGAGLTLRQCLGGGG